ncbi:hypothetical protein NC652_033358 [Populus alba x Populus x berolinensis]|nr:hypothetical protein NC652_033358 [Populus alba x Populus x berolinensis]
MNSCAIFTVDQGFGGYVASYLPYFSLFFFIYNLQLSHFFLFAPKNALKIRKTLNLLVFLSCFCFFLLLFAFYFVRLFFFFIFSSFFFVFLRCFFSLLFLMNVFLKKKFNVKFFFLFNYQTFII